MNRPDAPPIEIAERVLRILDEGRYTATYKQAVLVALLDLCLERTKANGDPPDTITTVELAHKVCELYWPHTRAWSKGRNGIVLVQNSSGNEASRARGGGIVAMIRAFREEIELVSKSPANLPALRHAEDPRYIRLIRSIEWTLVQMPLPKLQRVGNSNPEWLYHIHWKDESERDPRHSYKSPPKKEDFAAYWDELSLSRVASGTRKSRASRAAANDEPTGINNLIQFQPGVGAAFARLHGMLRPFILRHWAEKVAALNGTALGDENLMGFLFGENRASLQPVLHPLLQIQKNLCFYCKKTISGEAHVDHFIPWARHPDNGLHNLVAADERCNGAKRDYLASITHLEKWRVRAVAEHESLARIAVETRWEEGAQRIVGVARAIYLTLPREMPLWQRAREFEPSDPDALRRVLVA
jgi:hypothetical protein